MYPRRLVFCGGGTRCLVFLQTLVDLETHGRLRDVRECWGTSAGALIAALYALSKSAVAVKHAMQQLQYNKFLDIEIHNLINIHKVWGTDNGHSMIAELERIFEIIRPGSTAYCLRDVPGLNIVVADLNEHKTIVCNSETYGNLRIIEALRASMGLPIFFCPYVEKSSGHYWVDGGVRDNFGWNVLPDDAARSEALGFLIDKGWSSHGPKSFTDYLFSIIHFDEPGKIRSWKESWTSNIIVYACPPYPAWFARLREDDWRMVEDIGAAAATAWLTLHPASDSGTPGSPRASAPHCTPPSSSPAGQTDGTSGIPLLHLPSPPPAFAPPPPSYTPPASRRWSV